jgi:ATP-dependent RNA helicase DeaD
VNPPQYPVIARGLARAKIAHRVEPIPKPEAIQRAREEKLVAWLAREGDGETVDPHAVSIAKKLLESTAPETAVARLVVKAGLHGPTRARAVRAIPPPREREETRERREHPRGGGDAGARPRGEPSGRHPAKGHPLGAAGWVAFRVTWGGRQGADARRLLALACRRGNIRGTQIGAIRIEDTYSTIEIAREVAESFEREAGKHDPRDPRVRITREREERPHGAGERPHRPDRPSHAHAHARRVPPQGGEGPPRHRKSKG